MGLLVDRKESGKAGEFAHLSDDGLRKQLKDARVAARYQPCHGSLTMTRTPDVPDGVIAYALRASGFGFETISALLERGLVDARLQRLAHPRVDVVPRRANEKAKGSDEDTENPRRVRCPVPFFDGPLPRSAGRGCRVRRWQI